MNSIQKTNYVQFDNDIVVDTISGLPIGASQIGFARITGAAESSVRYWVNSSLAGFEILSLEIHTSGGLKGSQVIPMSAFKAGFKKFNPDLLEAASDYGITAYTLHLAGYVVPAVQPAKPPTYVEALRGWADAEEKALALAAQIEEDLGRTLVGKRIEEVEAAACMSISGYARHVGIGRNKLFAVLREIGVIQQNNTQPYQAHIDSGYMLVTQKITETRIGDRIDLVTLLTPRGEIWLTKKLAKYNQKELVTVQMEKEVVLID